MRKAAGVGRGEGSAAAPPPLLWAPEAVPREAVSRRSVGWRAEPPAGRAGVRGRARVPSTAFPPPALQLRCRDRGGRAKPWRARDTAGQAPYRDRRPHFSGHIFLLYLSVEIIVPFGNGFLKLRSPIPRSSGLSRGAQQQTRVCKRLWHLYTLFDTSPVLSRVLIKQYQQLFGKTEKNPRLQKATLAAWKRFA